MSTERNDQAEAAAALRLVLEAPRPPDVEADEVHLAYLRGAADALEQAATASLTNRSTSASPGGLLVR